MARLPYVDPEQSPEPVRDAMQQLPRHLNIFKMMAHAETCFRPLLRLGAAILAHQELDAKLRELAVLQVAKLVPGRYEWVQHVPIAKAVGATDAQIEAIEGGRIDADCFDARERLLLRFNADVIQRAEVSDQLFAEMRRQFSPREIVELILTDGYYSMLAVLTEVTETDLESPAGTAVVDAIE
jgi:alkylhydroperoxidase family enzyme